MAKPFAGAVKMLADALPIYPAAYFKEVGSAGMAAKPVGILASLKPGGTLDRIALMLAVLGQAIPSFWLGLILIVVFGVWYGLVPISGTESWQGYILPVVVLSYYAMPALMRLTRAGMIDVLTADYIRTARAKGASQPRVLLVHALRNAVLPLVSLAAVQFGLMLSGGVRAALDERR